MISIYDSDFGAYGVLSMTPFDNTEYQRQYRIDNAARLREQSRLRKERDPVKYAAQKRADYLNHMDAYKARAKAHREANADKIKARRSTPEYKARKNALRKVYYQGNKEMFKGLWDKHPYWMQKYLHSISKAQGKGAEVIDRRSIKEYYRQVFTQDNNCEYCAVQMTPSETTIDHKTPFILKGVHAVSNLAVCCTKCNIRKGPMPFDKWLNMRLTLINVCLKQ